MDKLYINKLREALNKFDVHKITEKYNSTHEEMDTLYWGLRDVLQNIVSTVNKDLRIHLLYKFNPVKGYEVPLVTLDVDNKRNSVHVNDPFYGMWCHYYPAKEYKYFKFTNLYIEDKVQFINELVAYIENTFLYVKENTGGLSKIKANILIEKLKDI